MTATGLVADGDAAFIRVDNRRPAHALEPGVVAAATNCRFDNGKPRPRFGVALDGWGYSENIVPGGAMYSDNPQTGEGLYTLLYTLTGLTVGQDYILVRGNALTVTDDTVETEFINPGGNTISPGRFTAATTELNIWGDAGATNVSTQLFVARDTLCYSRFDDPGTNTDNGILITDGWRTSGDGGLGRAWRILPGNTPIEIDLNGHDVWGECRLVQCHNAMVLLRHGNERHYWTADDCDDAVNDRFSLHCAPSWGVGTARRVRFELATAGAAIYGTSPPAAGNYYYAKHITGNKIELYTDVGLTNKLDYSLGTTPVGKYYIELATSPTPINGNVAPPLILQPGVDTLAFDNGFVAVSSSVTVTGSVAASDLLTAPNHRLVSGDLVNVSLDTDTFTGKYVAPQSEHTFRLYPTEAESLADTGSGMEDVTVDDQVGSVTKSGASGLPMPGGREGCYYKGRFIVCNGRDNLYISDPFDFVHYTLFAGDVAANLGESGYVRWLLPLGEDTLLVGKDSAILAISGLSGDYTGWRMEDVTREYGGVAALAAVNVGTDVWLMSRKGVASVVRTVAGERLGVARTVSHAIPEYLNDLDWTRMAAATAAVWNNRFFLAVPTKNQDDPVNNRVLVHNFLNQFLRVEQGEMEGEIAGSVVEQDNVVDAWEGAWSGDWLQPFAFARLTIAGEERLTFATPDGLVCWLHDGWDDVGDEIETSLTTRGYFRGREMVVTGGVLTAETHRPVYSVAVKTAGYQEQTDILTDHTPSATTYAVYGAADYDPNTSTTETFEAPHREDYAPTAAELFVAELDVHQTVTERLPMRLRDRAPQLVVSNTQGSLRLVSASVQGFPIGMAASRST